MNKDRLFIVFGMEHYNPLGIIRSLGEEGITPTFIAVEGKDKIASSSKYVGKVHNVEDHIEGGKLLLEEYGNFPKDNLPIVITTDEEQVEYMDEHYEDYKGKFIFFNAGEAGRISKYVNKFNILELAKEKGLKTLESHNVKRGEIPENLKYPVITKAIDPAVGGWKADVFICENKEELLKAYEKIKSPRVLLQTFINKKTEVSLEGFCINHGKQNLVTTKATQLYNIKGYYSPYHTVENFLDEEIYPRLNAMFEEIGFEGIYEVEFIIDNDDNYYFSEINFRPSAWNYSSTVAGMNLPYLWGKCMVEGNIDKSCFKKIDKFERMVEPVDFQKRVIERGYPVEKWLEEYKRAKCKYYYNENDLRPFFLMLEKNELYR